MGASDHDPAAAKPLEAYGILASFASIRTRRAIPGSTSTTGVLLERR